jgi:RNA recognition motif-containing protein
MKIYVGNLSRTTTDQTLQQAFMAYGQVISATIITDKFTGQPRGFGFVEMPDLNQAQTAIAELNGKALDGNMLTVNEARPREPRDRGYDGRRSGYGSSYGDRRPSYGGGRSSGGGPGYGSRQSDRRRSY